MAWASSSSGWSAYMRSKDSSPPAPRWAWLPLIAVGVIGHGRHGDLVPRLARPRARPDGRRAPELVRLPAVRESCRWSCCSRLVEIGQFIRWLVSFLVGQVDRIAPFRVSATIVVVLLVTLTITLLNGVVLKFAMRTMNNTFALGQRRDDVPIPRRRKPSCAQVARSRWCRGSRWAIRAGSSSRPAPPSSNSPRSTEPRPSEPIRAYAGLDSADGIDGDRGAGRAGAAAHRRIAARRRRGRHSPPAPAGSTRRKPTRWSTCTTATPRS